MKDIIEDSRFNDFLQEQINAYNNRPSPGKGLRYKRTPFDALKDEGKFNAESIRTEFVRIANRESRLSRAGREAITGIVFEAARQTVNFRAKEAESAEKVKQTITELKTRKKVK
jgi:transposase-like protein